MVGGKQTCYKMLWFILKMHVLGKVVRKQLDKWDLEYTAMFM